MRDPTYPLFPIFAFLGFFICLLPLSWHFQAWNAGTCAFMIWTALACLVEFVNSIIWSGNVDNVAPIWCDISSKFLIGAGVAIPAASLCISRRLYKIAALKTVSVSPREKRRTVIGDLCIAVGIPFLVMALHYIVQGHRFDILEDIGCYPATYNTLPAYFLVFLWPVGLGSVSFVYSTLTLRSFWMRRVQFSELASANNSMNVSRYLRLMVLAMTDMMCNIPLSIYSIYISNIGVALAPWISWSNTHYNFSQVDLIPSLIWRSDPNYRAAVELTRWLFPISAFIFFALFGFASEAQKNYRLAFWWVAQCFGVRPPPPKTAKSTVLPQGWQKPLKTSSAYPTSPMSPASRKHRPDSLTSSLAGSHVDIELDIEKSAGLSLHSFPSPVSTAPPEYSHRNASERYRPEAVVDDNDAIIAVSADSLSLPSSRCPPSAPFYPVTFPPSPQSFSSAQTDVMTTLTGTGVSENTPATAPLFGPLGHGFPSAIQVMVHTETTESIST